MTGARLVAAVVVVWLVVGAVSLVVFSAGDERPGAGRGDPFGQAP